ncbi:BrnT family toxin [Neorhizobium galegae]|uniref:BrnT family toxin n=1 Tax=Neorhizobium galegae TaxID=399 RepID=UPI0032AF5ABC
MLTVQDRRQDYGEDRFITLGAIAGLIVVVAVHTDRHGITRLISARLANRKERIRYHVHITAETESLGGPDR